MDNHGVATTTTEIIFTKSIFTTSFSKTGDDNVSHRHFQGQWGVVGQKTDSAGSAYDPTVITTTVFTVGSYADPTAIIIYLILIRFSVICRDLELIRI